MPSCTITVKVNPRSSRDEVTGERGEQITIKLAAAPVKGAANKALLAFLSKRLGVPKSDISITGGETGRQKRLRIDGLDETTVRQRLLGHES